MKRFTLLLCIFSVAQFSIAQGLESVTFLTNFSKEDVSQIAGINVKYGVDTYKVRYYTQDINGERHIASGLLCIPEEENFIFPLLCYQHGTVSGRTDVPSKLNGDFPLALAISSFGYVVTAADYIGLGDSAGLHPYVHADTEASAAIDMLLAVREFDAIEEDFQLNDQLFITGYSQGGHAAMAVHREIEMNYRDEFTVTAASAMSGPYSISGIMVENTLQGQVYNTVSYLAWIVLSYQYAYPGLLSDYQLEDIFKSQYIPDIEDFRDEIIDLWELNIRLSTRLIQETGAVIPAEMVHDSITDALLNDPEHPLHIALADNDVFDWAPKAPTRLFYCVGDEQIFFENALLAETAMNANGAEDILAIQNDESSPLSHGECVAPATFFTLVFFNDYQEITTSAYGPVQNSGITSYYDGSVVRVQLPQDFSGEAEASLIDLNGRPWLSRKLSQQINLIETGEIPPGIYVLQIINNGKVIHIDKLSVF